MGFFDVVRRKSDLERLIDETRSAPTAANLAALAERYLATGDVDKALEAAKQAADRFPDSERARITWQSIRKIKMQAQIVALQKRIAQAPAASDYEVLANIYYRELDHPDKASEVIREGLERFPKSEGLHFLDGSIRFDRFHREFIGRDGGRCIERLREATRLNPQNYKAWLLLVRLYGEIGLHGPAQECVQALRRIAPGDDTVERVARAVAGPAAVEDLDEALRAVEENGGFSAGGQAVAAAFGATVAAARGRRAVDPAQARLVVRELAGQAWALGAFVFTPRGEPVAHDVRSGQDAAAWRDAVLAVYRCAESASRGMDLGGFAFGALDGSAGRVHLREGGTGIVAAVAQPSSRPGDVESAVERAADSL